MTLMGSAKVLYKPIVKLTDVFQLNKVFFRKKKLSCQAIVILSGFLLSSDIYCNSIGVKLTFVLVAVLFFSSTFIWARCPSVSLLSRRWSGPQVPSPPPFIPSSEPRVAARSAVGNNGRRISRSPALSLANSLSHLEGFPEVRSNVATLRRKAKL